jgi:hypothetical protein
MLAVSKRKRGCPGGAVVLGLCLLACSLIVGPGSAAAANYLYLPLIFKNYPIANPHFDLGRDGSWKEYSSNDFLLVLDTAGLEGIVPHSGNWAAWLGGADNETSTLSQTIAIPPGATYLNFYYMVESYDLECGYDFLEIYLGDSPILSYDLCAATNINSWTLRKIDVTAFRGKTLELAFWVITDSFVDSWSNVFIDTISLTP